MYSMIPGKMEKLRGFIDKNLVRGFSQPAKSKIAAPVLFKEKKAGSLRMFMDYRGINAICIENMYPLPLMKDMVGYLSKENIFTKLDLRGKHTTEYGLGKGMSGRPCSTALCDATISRWMLFGLQGAPAVIM